MDGVNLLLIMGAGLLAAASPGPATLTIAGTSMQHGRRTGLALALGITAGSLTWSFAAAFGLGAIMLANSWVFGVIRYVGAAYLLYLAVRSARSALRPGATQLKTSSSPSLKTAFGKGLALHLTNPKAVLFFGSVYAIAIPPGTAPTVLLTVIAVVSLQSAIIFHGYALLFSSASAARIYLRLRRIFETVFAAAFATASWQIFTAKLG